ncbi:DUF2878 domain-containing protein [Marinobacter nanhaiticus D15-8W]|uniref:DUF2878 domain-containing protein n=1 Tax=Marinobacter nanhaiticus D15-8W TaxID=626887 RepID=N6WQN2_9GAMM|nr:DUF2878 domain-containing protein [Marinobacter nanhaiticus]ENO13886.1 DUF2878 domain-containing protein [Marinobacter nanhaiticus D15-8W]BES71263.1 DUF2878 domain-containing protein [Marinobacter nanhaiticus D15-8W]
MIQHALARNVTNFILFQVGWLTCVIFPGYTAVAVAGGIVVIHLVLVSQRPGREIQFILLGTLLGSLLDGLWFKLGVLIEPGAGPHWTPAWLVGLWAVFMTTLAHSLAWMGRTVWLPFVLAPVAGPFAYWSATRIGPIVFPDLLVSLIALAVGWALLFPLLMQMKHHYFREITPV